jgi:hypothetical protein
LIALGAVLSFCGSRFRCSLIDELLIWLPAGTILLLISSQTGINSHLRYLLPLFPFLFICISRVGLLLVESGIPLDRKGPLTRLSGAAIVVVAVGVNVLSTVRIHPHYLSYFNELAGGPENGWRHLLESNIDWGQDLLFLKRWVKEHPEACRLRLAYYGGIDPHLVGLDYQLPPFRAPSDIKKLQPGWYAVSINLVYGIGCRGYDEYGQNVSFEPGAFTYFQCFTPVDKAGYSLLIYHITQEESNGIRSKSEQP